MEYRKFKNSLSENDSDSYVSLIFNSDGAPVFKSSNFAVWPIQLIVNEVPINVRNENPITVALWFGKTKPPMEIFLQPFVDSINSLSEKGIACKILNEVRWIKPFAICCCVDSGARSPMQGRMFFNAYEGCSWCEHPGTYKDAIKYPLLTHAPCLRSEFNSLNQINEALISNKPVSGFKFVTPLINLKFFKLIRGFVPDHMHAVSEGVTKQFVDLWVKSVDKLYYLD